jgi:ABC-type multidrug transport system fused ATPase/permease subunit
MHEIWLLLTQRQRRYFVALIGVNLIAAAAEVLGVFSVLPFLALAANPSVCRSNATIARLYELGGFRSEIQFVIAAGVVTVVAILLTNAIAIGSLWFRTWYCHEVAAEMSDRLFRGYLGQPYVFFLSRNSSVLGKDLLAEVQVFFTTALEPVTILISRGLQIAAVAIALLVYDWKTTLVATILFGGFYGVVYALATKRIHRYGSLRYTSNEDRYRLASEALGGIKEIKLFGREDWYADAFERASATMVMTQGRVAVLSLSPRYLIEILVFSTVTLTVVSKLARGESFDDLAPSLGVFAVAGLRLLPTIQLVFQYASVLVAGRLAIQRLTELFGAVGALERTPSLPTHDPQLLRLSHTLAIDGISFAYGTDAPPVLEDVSFAIRAPECVGICGPSGSGKTTLMDLCLGLLEPSAGSITIDGRRLTPENASAWQRSIGYVPQSIYLIDGTIAENIAFSTDRVSIDLAAVRRAAKLAHLDDVIGRSPQGFDTVVGERGVRLSGGQRQRVAIARALYRDPDVLFFDEATSALDSESEAQVVEAIQSLAHLKTIIIVAHRLSTLRYCDVIHELKHGRIVRSCGYEELVQQAATASGRDA